MSKNVFEQVLNDAQAERERRKAKRKEEQAQYHKPLPDFVRSDDMPLPFEVRDYLHAKIRSLLKD